MEHGARQNTTRASLWDFISLGTPPDPQSCDQYYPGGINNYRLQTEQKSSDTDVIQCPFAVSQNQADASYIEQLGMSFVALRLNASRRKRLMPSISSYPVCITRPRRTASRSSWLKMRNALKTQR